MTIHQAPVKQPQLFTVTQLAGELGLTPRTLRFYEGKGLISPNRVGTTRVYMARDRARMIIIMRGKRLGFSLREIADYLDLYDADPSQKTQTGKLLKLVRNRIAKLEDQRIALEEMLSELREIEHQSLAVLAGTETGTPAETS